MGGGVFAVSVLQGNSLMGGRESRYLNSKGVLRFGF